MQYSRLGVGRLIALECVAQVVLVVHVALGAQVIIEAHLALPSHSHDAVLLAAVADDVGVTHAWRRKERREESLMENKVRGPRSWILVGK